MLAPNRYCETGLNFSFEANRLGWRFSYDTFARIYWPLKYNIEFLSFDSRQRQVLLDDEEVEVELCYVLNNPMEQEVARYMFSTAGPAGIAFLYTWLHGKI